MGYIIENSWLQKEKEIIQRSFVVEQNKIAYIGKNLTKLHFVRMNASPYEISPGHVYVDDEYLNYENIEMLRDKERSLIQKGCTTILVSCPITYVKQLSHVLRRAAHAMINSSLDYVIGVSTPLPKINAAFIRNCRRLSVPFIVAELTSSTELEKAKWGWWQEANFPNPIPIYPKWKPASERKELEMQHQWNSYCKQYHIPTVSDFHGAGRITKRALMQCGLYPKKGDLLVGSDVDYLLYNRMVEENENLHYDRHIPSIVVLRGRILKAGHTIISCPGYGAKITIPIAGRFSPI